jgi:hypothetical protein
LSIDGEAVLAGKREADGKAGIANEGLIFPQAEAANRLNGPDGNQAIHFWHFDLGRTDRRTLNNAVPLSSRILHGFTFTYLAALRPI